MASQQRGKRNPSTRGDFTGNKKEALQREHEEQVSARREEIGLANANKQAVKDDGVISLMSGQPELELDDPDLTRALAAQQAGEDDTDLDVEVAEAVGQQPTPVEQGTRLGSGTTNIDVFELEPERPQAASPKGEVLDADRLNEPTLIRSLYDVEDVTIGYGNTFTFREGYRYRVPRWVAAHLEEKGLADVLSLSLT